MRHIIYKNNLDYEDLGESVSVELKLIGAWLYLETPIERVAINDKALRYDGTPKTVLEFALNNAGKIITILDLYEAGIKTSRNLQQIVTRAGIKGYIRDIFMPECDKYQIKLLNKVSIKPQEAAALIEPLI